MKNFWKFSIICVFLSSAAAFAIPSFDTKTPLSGETLLPVKEQQKVMLPVYTTASRFALKSCDKMSIIDTKVTKKPFLFIYGNGQTPKEWEERWILFACGTKIYVPIKFTTNPAGITHLINQKNINFYLPMN